MAAAVEVVDARLHREVRRRKLFDRDPRQTALLDKLAAKRAAARLLGPE